MQTTGGFGRGASIVFVTAINGSPASIVIDSGSVCADGSWHVDVPVPASAASTGPLELMIQAASLSPSFMIAVSPQRPLTIE